MIKHKKFAIKAITFILVLIIVVHYVNYILMPKYYFNMDWPTTACYRGFYQMHKDSIDVLFFGSSHVVTAFNPQVLYDNNHITSYNLGCEQQNMLTTYYWLKEALKYQHPKVVVVDVLMLFEYDKNEPLNTTENCTRKAFDCMKWSDVKWEAIHDICKYDTNQTLGSYYFPNVRYHTRWTFLSEEDLAFPRMEKHYEMKGYTPFFQIGVHDELIPYSKDSSTEFAPVVPLMKEYLDKIVELCKAHQITLLLVKTPTTVFDSSKHNTVAKYADEQGILFEDFNEQTIYDSCNFIFTEDMRDVTHSNVWGAEKLTLYLGNYLSSKFGIMSENHCEQWSNTSEYYQNILKDCKLPYITDIYEYIDAIKQKRYTILITVYNDTSWFMSDEIANKFKELGLQFELEKNDSYYAVLGEGNIYEKRGQEALIFYGSTRNKLVDYKISSTGDGIGECYVEINNAQYVRNRSGINIVVYNNDTMNIIDIINFNGNINR